MMGFPRRLTGLSPNLRRFRSADAGNVGIIMALCLVVLMLSIGAAVDIGRWLHARDQTLAAIDAAVLAGGRALQMTNGDQPAAVAAATNFYNQNVKSRLPVIDDSVTFKVADNGMGLNASGNAFIKTPFLQFASIDKLPLISTAQTKFDGMGSQIGMKSGGDTEISVMLDVTGSMAGQKLKDLKKAAQLLVDVVTTANKSGGKYTTKLAIVPFSEDIRLPTSSARNLARGTSLPSKRTVGSGRNKTTYYLSDCVVERTGNQKYTDDAPASNRYVMGHYTTTTTGSGNNKKGDCTVPSDSYVQPLTSDTTLLREKIESLSASGGTAGHLGTAWAWYTLSPNWNSLWATDNQAKPYPDPAAKDGVQKVAILMTDGDYNTQYDSDGILANYGSTSYCPDAANGCSTTQALALCGAMKQKGIELYTVGFKVGAYSSAAQTLKTCATDDTKYYNADDGDALSEAFADIAIKLTTVYLSK
ncbi:MAG: pilus assembly protein [Hyphomicrobium sp.]|jgi:hypothetical protein